MALTHEANIRNAMCNAAVDALDAGAGANGTLVMTDSGDVTVSTNALSNPAFGDPTNGTANGNPVTDDSNAVGGTAALCVFNDTDGNPVFRGTVTATGGGGDIELNDVNIAPGAVVSITSMTYTASP